MRRVEALVNGWVAEGHPVATAEMPIAEAKQAGALAMFDEKYGDTVRVRGPPVPRQPSSTHPLTLAHNCMRKASSRQDGASSRQDAACGLEYGVWTLEPAAWARVRTDVGRMGGVPWCVRRA